MAPSGGRSSGPVAPSPILEVSRNPHQEMGPPVSHTHSSPKRLSEIWIMMFCLLQSPVGGSWAPQVYLASAKMMMGPGDTAHPPEGEQGANSRGIHTEAWTRASSRSPRPHVHSWSHQAAFLEWGSSKLAAKAHTTLAGSWKPEPSEAWVTTVHTSQRPQGRHQPLLCPHTSRDPPPSGELKPWRTRWDSPP